MCDHYNLLLPAGVEGAATVGVDGGGTVGPLLIFYRMLLFAFGCIVRLYLTEM